MMQFETIKLRTTFENIFGQFVWVEKSHYKSRFHFFHEAPTKKESEMNTNSPRCEDYKSILCDTISATNFSVRSNLLRLIVEKQNKLVLNSFDDKRISRNPMERSPWDEHNQDDCKCIL